MTRRQKVRKALTEEPGWPVNATARNQTTSTIEPGWPVNATARNQTTSTISFEDLDNLARLHELVHQQQALRQRFIFDTSVAPELQAVDDAVYAERLRLKL